MALLGRFKKITPSVADKESSIDIALAGKWTLYFILIGIIAGLGSVVFHYLCQIGVHYFMEFIAGYRPPAPAGCRRR